MRLWLSAFVGLGLGLSHPLQAAAKDIPFGGFVFIEAARFDARDSLVNPNDLFRLSSDQLETAILVEGDIEGFSWRLRGEAIGDVAHWPERKKIRVQELAYQRKLSERWSFSIGKQERSWDSGLAFRPLGFFRTRPDIRDPTDREGRQQGLPLISATYIGDQFTAEIVASDDVFGDLDEEIEARQWAGRVSGQIGKMDASLVVRQAAGQRPGIGGSLTYAMGAIELHGDAYLGPGRRMRRHRGLVGGEAEEVPGDLYPSDPSFIDRGGGSTTLDSVVGITWTPIAEFAVTAEYIHQGGGLSDERWTAYLDLIATHRAALDTGFRGLAIANLAYDLSVLRGTVRKDYLYVRSSGFWHGFTMSGLAFVGLADGGGILTGALTRTVGQKIEAQLAITAFVGGSKSEFGLVPFGTVARLSLRRPF
ncbi:MAG TPA: hypothetical protein VE053_04490 [Allosphingosinicella sp.]|nr:hypothetical protein [Allosphingosinicella sp.]